MLKILSARMHTLPMRTRLPFRYGIVTLREVEHCVVSVRAEIDGVVAAGVAADSLAPKWFTKDPGTPIEHDVAEMTRVIADAGAQAERIGPAASPFEFWLALYSAQASRLPALPALLRGFGVSLIERALIDAFCRAKGMPFARAVRENALGVRLGALHPELASAAPGDLLPPHPLQRVIARHTVGLIDPLREGDIAAAEHVADGLPQSLEACIREYGLTHFKIKLCGDGPRDLARLIDVAGVIERECRDFAFTLDGNEQYGGVDDFRAAWRAISAAPALGGFMRRLIFVEQPLHRDAALSDATGEALRTWADRPPIIIDESDGDLDGMRLALARGYAGTSHKNCKGVFKGIANACLAARRQAEGKPTIVSGEDLCNIGPVALTQDLAVMATLGVAHVERNGHHYFKGLAMFPEPVQADMVERHGDLFGWRAAGFAAVAVRQGAMAARRVVEAPFGYSGRPELLLEAIDSAKAQP